MLGHRSSDVFFVAKGHWQGITGLRLEALTHRDLPFIGPGRNSTGSWDVMELEVLLRRPGQAEWEKQKLVNASADFSQVDQKVDDGKKSLGSVAYLIDGKDENAWKADRGEGRAQPSFGRSDSI